MENEPVQGILIACTDNEQKEFRDGYVEGFLNSAKLMKWLIEREHLEHKWAYEAVLRYTNSVLSHWKERERCRERPPYHSKEQYDPQMQQIIEQVSKLQEQEESNLIPCATVEVQLATQNGGTFTQRHQSSESVIASRYCPRQKIEAST